VSLFFPDNTVLINFAVIGRVDLLEKLANGNGRWCLSVSQECAKSARVDGLAALNGVRDFLGEPLEPTPAELLTTRMVRDSMAAPGDQPTKHLGEAETIAIVTSRDLQSTTVFVSDDSGALIHAEAHGLMIADTWDLLALAERVGMTSAEEHARYVAALQSAGRRRPRR
jgi:predicted nucleic acid-binding protein